MQALHEIQSLQWFAKGDRLFWHGAVATGVYLVERSEVRVFLLAGQSQLQLPEVSAPGTALGLS